MKFFLIQIIIPFFLFFNNIYSQCGCPSDIPTFNINPYAGTTNVGIIPEKHLRFNIFLLHSFGNKYYENDVISNPSGSALDFNSNFTSFAIGYGWNPKFSTDIETGYFFNKTSQYSKYNEIGKGFSNTTLNIKYSLFNDIENEFEMTLGGGVKIPLQLYPILLNNKLGPLSENLQPSTGAYSGVFQSFLHKGFLTSNWHLFLINRYEINSKNRQNYQFGNSCYSSIFGTILLLPKTTIIFELRNEIHGKDNTNGIVNINTGGYSFTFVPQINYNFDKAYISIIYDLPIYHNFIGNQMGLSYSIGLNLSWQFKI